MITNVTYKEDGSLNIDNSELLSARADINNEVKAQNLINNEGNGGIPGKEEDKLKSDLKGRWHEAKKATDVKHKCPICGTIYWGRPNKAYCGTPCKEVAKKRRSRKRKRDIRDFTPYRGKSGEVYFMDCEKNNSIITFVPAFYSDTRNRAKEYLEGLYTDPGKIDDYVEQVNAVIKK